MGGGQRTPQTSSPAQHSGRYESGVSQTGQSSSLAKGRGIRADGGQVSSSDQEIRDKWIRPDGDLVTSEGYDVFSQRDVDELDGTFGVQDSWEDLESASPDSVAASQFGGGSKAINGVMDSDGQLHEQGANELQSVGVQNKIAESSNHFDADSVKALGSKINRLRDEHGGSFNFHEPEVADEFSLGEKEMLANWEIAGRYSDNITEYTGSEGFMDTAVVEQDASSEVMASALEQHDEVLVQTHNNSTVDEVSESLRDHANAGTLPEGVDVDAVTEKLHAQQRSTHLVAVERDTSLSVQRQAELFSPARDGRAETKGANVNLEGFDSHSQFSANEVESVAQSVAEGSPTVDEFQRNLSKAFGFREGGHAYEDSVSLPSERVTVLNEEGGESSVTLETGFTEDGKLHSRKVGAQSNPNPLPYSMDDVRCVYTETQVNDHGEVEVTDVEVGSIDDFEVSEVKSQTTRKAKFEPSGEKVQVVDSDGKGPVSRDPAVREASDVREDVMGEVTSPSEVNAAPESASVPTMDELRDDLESELFDAESGSDVFATGIGEGSEVKQTGDDAEAIAKSAMFENVDPKDMRGGDDETYEFGDSLRSMVEVKAYDSDRVEKQGVGLGSEDPWSNETVDKSLSTEHTEWSEENCTPSNTRYVVMKHNQNGMDKSDISLDDVKTVASRQPSVGPDDMFKEGADSVGRIDGGESTVQDEIRDEFADKMGRIEGVVIASGEAISKSSDVDLNVKKTHEISRASDDGVENASLDDF